MWNKYTGDLNLSCLTCPYFGSRSIYTKLGFPGNSSHCIQFYVKAVDWSSTVSSPSTIFQSRLLALPLLCWEQSQLLSGAVTLMYARESQVSMWELRNGDLEVAGIAQKSVLNMTLVHGEDPLLSFRHLEGAFPSSPQQNVFLRTLLSFHGRIPKRPKCRMETALAGSPSWV